MNTAGTVTYTGEADNATVTLLNTPYYNLVISKAGETFNLGAAGTVVNTLQITAGTFSANAYTLGVMV